MYWKEFCTGNKVFHPLEKNLSLAQGKSGHLIKNQGKTRG
jgi:hypothetical protein